MAIFPVSLFRTKLFVGYYPGLSGSLRSPFGLGYIMQAFQAQENPIYRPERPEGDSPGREAWVIANKQFSPERTA
jgi:hypothetical protein